MKLKANSKTKASPKGSAAPIITSADVAALTAACAAFVEALGDSAKTLSSRDLKRLPKPRKGAEPFVKTAMLLASKYNLVSPSYPKDVVLANQQLVRDLLPVLQLVTNLHKLVLHSSCVAQANAWAGAMASYRLMRGEARSNSALETSIETLRTKLRPQLKTAEGTKTVKQSRSVSAKARAAKTVVPE